MAKPSSSKALSHKQGGGCGPGCVIYFVFGIILLVGGVNSYVMLFQPLMKYVSVLSWKEIPCEIVESDLNRRGSELTAYVEYTYTVKKQEYRCAQLRFHGHSSGNEIESDADDWEKRLQVGSKTDCFVDMGNPRQAVLIRDFPMEMLFGLIPLVFLGIGVGGLIIGPQMVKGQNKARQASADWQRDSQNYKQPDRNDLVSRIRSQLGDGGLSSWVPEGETGPQELKTNSTPLGTFFGLVVFSLIWNGVVSIFLVEIVSDWQAGNGSWLMTLFFVPFVAIGIGAILGAIYSFLALFNPKVQMFVSSPSVGLGETLQAKWVLRGNLNGVSEFTVKLVGEEWCQYRRGTNTHTDTSKFYELVAVSTTDPYEIESGEVEIKVPADLMHSFDAPNNKVRWRIEVCGDIKFWPDVKNTFSLVVLPQNRITV